MMGEAPSHAAFLWLKQRYILRLDLFIWKNPK